MRIHDARHLDQETRISSGQNPVATISQRTFFHSSAPIQAKFTKTTGNKERQDGSETIQRTSGHASESHDGSIPPIVHDVLRSSGQPLDASARAYMEPRFGHDFGSVRVHTDTKAQESAKVINAAAYTSDRHIVFGSGRYAPSTGEGRNLLAHELTHVVQQRQGVSLKNNFGQVGDRYEQQADAVASAIAHVGEVKSLMGYSKHSPAKHEKYGPSTQVMRKESGGPRLESNGTIEQPYSHSTPIAKGDQMSQIDSYMKMKAMLATTPTAVVQTNVGYFSTLLDRLISKINKLEKALLGNATQSWGAMLWGEGSGRGSTATRASDDAKLWDSNDATDLLDLVSNVVAGMKGGTDAIDRFADLIASLKSSQKVTPKNLQSLASTARSSLEHQLAQLKFNQNLAQSGGTTKVNAVGPPALETPQKKQPQKSKVQLGQWAAGDLSGNTFIMIKYNDGSKRFSMGSVFGIREIDDPGALDWKQVQGSLVADARPSSSTKKNTDSKVTPIVGINSQLADFIAFLKNDPVYGSMVKITSSLRTAENDARAVLNNQKRDAAYYKIYTANWEAAILNAINGRNLSNADDYAAAVGQLSSWILNNEGSSPHVAGRAVDIGLGGGSLDFKNFIKTEAEKRGFKFIDESSKNHFHVQM